MFAKANHAVSAYQRETVPFLGLNRSDDVREGEFAAQKNMSDRRYPYLAPRLPRAKEEATADADALFYWDGHEVVAAGGILYLDGEAACNLTEGAKQFAVINSKLVVWPDGVAVDLNDHSVTNLSVTAVNRGTARFTTDSLTLLPESVYAATGLRYTSYDERVPYLWTYDSVAWDETSGWTVEGGQWVLVHNCKGRCYIPRVGYNEAADSYSTQYPTSTYTTGTPTGTGEPGNDLGFYVKVTKVAEYERTVSSYKCTLEAEIYWAQQDGVPLDKLFRVGQAVSVTGTAYGALDVERRIIRSIDPDTNTLTFDPGIFRSGEAVGRLSKALDDTLCVRWTLDDNTYRYKTTKVVTGQAGWYIMADWGAGVVRMYDGDWVLQGEHAIQTTTSTSGYTTLTMTPVAVTQKAFTVTRPVPALDYIGQHDNRLWGVCSADNTIYASALGDPCTFYAYDGLSTDSYAVAVGSEGDFTGICSYGNAVLCWKERTLHKLLGSDPSNYQTAVYRFAGVRAGAHKSMVNVNETLFFLGVDGVYAYTGNRPSLISKALGADVLADGVGGTDGRAYYLSARNGEGWELLSYDTHTGLWTRSDEKQVADFCRVGDALKFLSGDSIYTIGAGDESVEWEAVFAPMYETLEGGKQYRRLIFRVEVPKDGWLAADVRFDDGRWMQVGIVKGKNGPVHMPVPLRRCDKFQIRLRGVGDCAVLDMVREFRLRGEH